jgi:hypothetical protein
MNAKTDKKRLIKAVDANKDIIHGDDGLLIYAPSNRAGGLSAWMLRAIADELDRRNKPWQKQLDKVSG